uniref:hypothetical protein n=1 Tax=Jatropha curcas TaxID=180498 RepID=UPI0027A38D1E|nr:hypothetical protein QLP06_mgp031 [Jatropha curcas]WFG81208.1 hypothetical protein [Jatropha curcas]
MICAYNALLDLCSRKLYRQQRTRFDPGLPFHYFFHAVKKACLLNGESHLLFCGTPCKKGRGEVRWAPSLELILYNFPARSFWSLLSCYVRVLISNCIYL